MAELDESYSFERIKDCSLYWPFGSQCCCSLQWW